VRHNSTGTDLERTVVLMMHRNTDLEQTVVLVPLSTTDLERRYNSTDLERTVVLMPYECLGTAGEAHRHGTAWQLNSTLKH
jgi:hypothetical protein